LIITIILTINGQLQNIQQQQRILPMFRDNSQIGNNNQFPLQTILRIPFPQCLTTDTASNLLNPSTLQNLFQIKLEEEDRKLKHERMRNNDLNNSMYKMIDLFNKRIFFFFY
jgi:hypothetical protein